MVFVAVAVQQEILCCEWLNQPVDSLVFQIHETRVRRFIQNTLEISVVDSWRRGI